MGDATTFTTQATGERVRELEESSDQLRGALRLAIAEIERLGGSPHLVGKLHEVRAQAEALRSGIPE